MRDRPIIFSGPMVRALLDGRKTMSRHIVKPRGRTVYTQANSLFNDCWADSYVLDEGNQEWREQDYSYRVGDRLYVRENWGWSDIASMPPLPEYPQFLHFAADGDACVSRWKPSIHMPRWASRLTLEVTGVKVERLQDISVDDAVAEGIEESHSHGLMFWGWKVYDDPGYETISTQESFASLWRSINGPDAWDSNPWVVAISFKTTKANIDAMKAEAA